MTRTPFAYLRWVTRDINVVRPRTLWPYFQRREDQISVSKGEKVLVNACWNGLTVFDARWFETPSNITETLLDSSRPAIERLNRTETLPDGDVTAKLPLRFRTSQLCHASECLLTSLDMHRLSSPIRPLIYVNPRVIVGMFQNLPSLQLARLFHVPRPRLLAACAAMAYHLGRLDSHADFRIYQ